MQGKFWEITMGRVIGNRCPKSKNALEAKGVIEGRGTQMKKRRRGESSKETQEATPNKGRTNSVLNFP
jgi:hypothetical protein